MSQQSTNSEFSPDYILEPGEWMYFPQAMEATGLTERSLRRYMQMKQVKYRKLGKSANARVQLYITDELRKIRQKGIEENPGPSTITDIEFDADPASFEGSEDAPVEYDSSWIMTEREKLRMLAEEMMSPLLSTIREQERQLQEKTRQLLLLPDLQKQAEAERQAAELKNLEVTALQKQIEALNAKITEQSLAEKNQILQLKLRLAELEKLESISREADLAKEKAAEDLKLELEKQTEEKLALEAALERMQLESETKKAMDAERKPWWKTWFGVGT